MFRNHTFKVLCNLILLALIFSATWITPARAAGILYVTPGGTGNCSSWATACTLQTALTDAVGGDEIWVMAGTYKPTTADPDSRTATFQLKDGVAVYGGFAGTEVLHSERNPATNATILSGDLNGDDVGFTSNTENAYHVVTGASGATLDGFTITAGNANGTSPHNNGGGMYNSGSSPTLTNITFSGNSAQYGGGMYNILSSSPALTNITFTGNSAVKGGAIYNDGSNPALINITFSGNTATNHGGGLYNINNSSPTLTNVTFNGNSATNYGGGVFSDGSNPQIYNAILWGNTATSGGAQIYNYNGSAPVVSDSVVQDGYAGTNIITADPNLGTLGNYGGFTQTILLLPNSSAINVGNGTYCPANDQRGEVRLGVCDIGAYEYNYTGVYYVKPTASGAANCQSWENACTLQNALATAASGDEVWVMAGTYKPTTTDPDPRTATFQLKDGVAVYGGFAGTESLRSERNIVTNVVTLNGDLNGNDNNTILFNEPTRVDNAYHVVIGATGAILDGFIITAGNANGVSPNDNGGGMYNPSGNSPTLTNVTFNNNSVTTCGGGMYNSGGSPILTNVTFSGNTVGAEGFAYSCGGGGMYNSGGSPILTNVTFSGNSAYHAKGGGMYNTRSSPILTNVTFSGNLATTGVGGGMDNFGYTVLPQIRNAIFWGNSGAQIYAGGTISISDSIVQYGYAGTNIITTDPNLGVLGNYGGFTQTIPLLPGSSAINAGNGTRCPTNDQRGEARLGTCDIGAYEYNYTGVYYVKPTASGTANCQSWANACALRDALKTAISGDEIWVMAGTHTPGINRTDTFQLKNGIAVYGGFAGTETVRSERNPATNVTILSGEIGAAGNSDNSYHVVTGASGATLDGFTITAGNANGNSPDNIGGGMLNDGSSPTLMNITFSGNLAAGGGGMYNNSSSNPTLTNITFSGNSAGFNGGGMYNNSSSNPTLTNVTFNGNSSADYGGGMYNSGGSNPQIRNTILWGNTATSDGAQIYNNASAPSVSYSVVEGGYAGGTNIIPADPKLGALGGDGVSTQVIPIQGGSSAINAGDNAVCPLTDQRGVARPQPNGGNCDIGAYEQDDLTAPTVAITSLTSNPTKVSPIAVSVTFSESVTGFTSTDIVLVNGAVGNFAGSGANYTFDLTPAGQGLVTANIAAGVAADSVGNGNTIAAQFSRIYDSIAPTTTIDNHPPNPNNDNTPTFNFSGDDGAGSGVASFQCKMDSGSYATCESPFNLPTLPDGAHTFYVKTIDYASNEDATSESYAWVVDTTAPTVSMSSPTTNSTNSSPIPVTVTFSEGVTGFIGDDIAVSNGTVGNFTGSGASYTFNLTPVGQGMVTADIAADVAQDYVGNNNTTASQFSRIYDIVAPDTTIDSQPADPSNDSTPSFTFSGGDSIGSGIDSYKCKMDSNSYSVCVSPFTSPVLLDGSHTFYVKAIDNASNEDATPASYTWVVEAAAPTITSINRVSAASLTNLVNIDFIVTFSERVTGVDVGDFKLVTALLTGASITNVNGVDNVYTVTVNTGTGNGTIRLDARNTATVQDLSGNNFFGPYTGGEIYIVSKGAAPTVPVLKSPSNNALVISLTPTLDWNDSSEVLALDVPGWRYEINVTSPYGYNETFNTVDNADPLVGLGASQYSFTTALPESTTFTWKVRAYNDQNQYSAWSASRTFRTPPAGVLTKLPAPVLTSPANTTSPALNNMRPTFSWDAVSGATSYTLQILKDGKAVNTGTIKAPLHSYTPTKDLLPETTYTWQVKANGKVSSDYSAPFTFKTSTNPPVVPVLVSPANKALVDAAIQQTLKWKLVSGSAASYEVEYATDAAFSDAGSGISSSTELSLPIGSLLSNRTYYWHVRSWSEAGAKGNHSTWSAVRTFRTKLGTPVLNLPANGTTLDSIRPTFTWDEVPGATTYTLQVLKDGKVVVTGNIKAPAYVYTPVKDLLPGITYTWKVKANGANPGDYSAPSTFTTSINPPKPPMPSAPANNALVDSSVTQVFKWSAVLAVALPASPAAGSYEVEYATNAGFINSSPTVKVNAPATETGPITLLPGRTYYWRVRSWSGANGTGNHSAWSKALAIKVKFVAPILTTPVKGATVGITPTFTWDSANGLWTNYTLQIATDANFKAGLKSFTIKAPVTTFTLPEKSALKPGTYFWRVKINGIYTPITSEAQSFIVAP